MICLLISWTEFNLLICCNCYLKFACFLPSPLGEYWLWLCIHFWFVSITKFLAWINLGFSVFCVSPTYHHEPASLDFTEEISGILNIAFFSILPSLLNKLTGCWCHISCMILAELSHETSQVCQACKGVLLIITMLPYKMMLDFGVYLLGNDKISPSDAGKMCCHGSWSVKVHRRATNWLCSIRWYLFHCKKLPCIINIYGCCPHETSTILFTTLPKVDWAKFSIFRTIFRKVSLLFTFH